MTNWRYTIDIKPHLSRYEDEGDHVYIEVRDAIVRDLKAAGPYPADVRFAVVVEGLEESQSPEDFNDWLQDLYDWADARRVWLGL